MLLILFLLSYFFTQISSQCLIPDTTNCKACDFSNYFVEFQTKPEIPFATSSCIVKTNTGAKDYIVNWVPCGGNACDGASATPFDSLIKGLSQGSLDAMKYLSSNITFHLTSGDHYIMDSDITGYLPLFRRTVAEISIVRLLCSFANIVGCISDTTRPRIIIKTSKFNIFVGKRLILSEINIIGPDMHLDGVASATCFATKAICCTDADNINPAHACYLKSKKITINPTNQKLLGIFVIEHVIDFFFAVIPEIIISNCKISELNFIADNSNFLSLIAFNQYQSKITLTSVDIISTYFFNGLFLEEDMSKTKLYEALVTANTFAGFMSKFTLGTDIKISLCTLTNYNNYQLTTSKTEYIFQSVTTSNTFEFSNSTYAFNPANTTFLFGNFKQSNILFSKFENLTESFLLNIASNSFVINSVSFANITITLANFISLSNSVSAQIMNCNITTFGNQGTANFFQGTNVQIVMTSLNVKNLVIQDFIKVIPGNLNISSSKFDNMTVFKSVIDNEQGNFSIDNSAFTNAKVALYVIVNQICPNVLQNNCSYENFTTLSTSSALFRNGRYTREEMRSITMKNIALIYLSTPDAVGLITILDKFYASYVVGPNFFIKTSPGYVINFTNFEIYNSTSYFYPFLLAGIVYVGNVVGSNISLVSYGLFAITQGLQRADNITVSDIGSPTDVWVLYSTIVVTFFGVKSDISNIKCTAGANKFLHGMVFCTSINYVTHSNLTYFSASLSLNTRARITGISRPITASITNVYAKNMRSIIPNPTYRTGKPSILELVKTDQGDATGVVSNITIDGYATTQCTLFQSYNLVELNITDFRIYNVNKTDLETFYIGSMKKATITNILFNNVISSISGFSIESSQNVIITNVETVNYTGVQSFFTILGSNVTITNVTANNLVSSSNGAFIFADSSILVLKFAKASKLYTPELGAGIFLWKSSYLTLEDSTITDCVSKYGGSLYVFQTVNLILNRNIFTNSSSIIAGGAFYIKSSVTLNSNNVTISNSMSPLQSGVIYINMIVKRLFIFNQTKIMNCTSTQGSGFFIMGQTDIEIRKLDISNNSISTIFSFSRSLIKILLEDITFTNLIEDSGDLANDVITFNGINATANNLMITFCKPRGKVVKAIDSMTNFLNTSISNNSNSINQIFGIFSFDSSAFNLSKISLYNILSFHLEVINCNKSYISNSSFSANDLQLANPINIENSEILFQTISFIQNKGKQSGVVYFLNSKLSFTNCIFNENYAYQTDLNKATSIFGSCQLTAILCMLSVIGSNFELTNGYSINVATLPYINIEDSDFSNSKNYPEASGVRILNTNGIKIVNSKFINCSSSLYGSGILTENTGNTTSQVNFNNLLISNSKGVAGSGFYISGPVNFSMSLSNLVGNAALGSASKSIGGAGYVNCDYRYLTCNSTVINNTFENNTAIGSIPDLFSATPITESGNVYRTPSKNLSQISYPLRIVFLKDILYEEQLVNLSGISNAVDADTFISVKSGNAFNSTYSVVDFFGKRLSFLNDCTGRIVFDDGSDISGGSIEKGFSNCQKGIIFFKNVKILAISNTTRKLSLQVSFKDIGTNDDINMKTNLALPIKLQMETCIKGEILLPDLFCQKCPENQYSLLNPMTDNSIQQCEFCPSNAICTGGDAIIPLNGYWRPSNDSKNIFQCTNKEACLNNYAPSNKTSNFQCLPIYTGNLCNDCSLGYARIFTGGPCVKCAGNSSIHLKFTFLIILLTAFILGQVFYYDHLKLDSISTGGVLIKILISHYQQLTLIGIIKLGWQVDVGNYFTFTNYLSFLSDDYYSNECFFAEFDTPLFLLKTVYTNIIPFLITAISLIFLSIYSFLKKYLMPKLWDFEFWTFVKMTFFLTVYLLYPELVSKGFALFSCMSLDETQSTTYLVQAPNVQCWTPTHTSVVYAVGVPSIFLWGLFIPLYFLYILFENRFLVKKILRKIQTIDDFNRPNQTILSYITKKTDKAENIKTHLVKLNEDFKDLNQGINSPKDNDSQSNSEPNHKHKVVKIKDIASSPESPTFKGQGDSIKKVEIFKFFYRGYRGSYYYWESLIFFKKAIFILLSSLSNEISSTVKIVLVLSQFILFFSLTQINYPYATEELNHVELISYHVLFICAIMGTLFFSPGVKDYVMFVVAIYIGLNIFVFFVWIHILVKTNLSKIYELKAGFDKLLKKLNGEKDNEGEKTNKSKERIEDDEKELINMHKKK